MSYLDPDLVCLANEVQAMKGSELNADEWNLIEKQNRHFLSMQEPRTEKDWIKTREIITFLMRHFRKYQERVNV